MTNNVVNLQGDTERLVGRVASAYHFTEKLFIQLRKIDGQNHKEGARNARRGLSILNWIGKAVRQIDAEEEQLEEDAAALKGFRNLQNITQEAIDQLQIHHKSLLGIGSRFRGKLRKELKEILRDEKLLASYEVHGKMNEQVKDELIQLVERTKHDVEELATWLNGAQATLDELRTQLQRRKAA